MIRSLFKLAVLLIIGILIYNYFFGTNEEQENSSKVFGQIRGVVTSVSHIISSEKDKFDAGKYDAALEKLGGVYKAIRTQAKHVDDKVIKRLDQLESRKTALEQELNEIEAADQQLAAAPASKKKDPKAIAKAAEHAQRKADLFRELEGLVRDSDTLLQDAGK